MCESWHRLRRDGSPKLLSFLKRLAVLGVGIALIAGVATAQNVTPVHNDIFVRMRVAGFSMPVELHQSGVRSRIDLSEGGVLQTYIADRDKGILISMTATGQSRIALVFPLDRSEGIVPLPMDLAIFARQARLKVIGAASIAGHPCRMIEFNDYLGQDGIVCASPENFILQMTRKGHKEPLFQVTEIIVGKQDPKWFRAPPEYQLAVVPSLGGASASAANVPSVDLSTGLVPAQPARPQDKAIGPTIRP